MAKDDVLKQFWAGIFALLGMAVVVGAIFFIGFQKGMTEPRFQITVLFDKVGGLTEKAPVRFSGVTVGSVAGIDFLDEEIMRRGLLVRLDIYKKFERQIRRSTEVSILTEGVLGAKYVEISREAGEATLDISRPILGESMLEVYDLAEVLEKTAGSFSDTAQGMTEMMHELTYISRKTKRLLDRIEQRVIDGNLFKVF